MIGRNANTTKVMIKLFDEILMYIHIHKTVTNIHPEYGAARYYMNKLW